MSWDVIIMRVPEGTVSIDEIPNDPMMPLGSSQEILNKLQTALPTANFSDPAWGTLHAQDFSIEFHLGKGETIESIMLHVRGGEASLAAIKQVCDVLGCTRNGGLALTPTGQTERQALNTFLTSCDSSKVKMKR